MPQHLNKYFWGDNLKDLSWAQHRPYITQTILEKGDQRAVKWLIASCGKKNLKSDLPKLKLSKKSKSFWSLYLN